MSLTLPWHARQPLSGTSAILVQRAFGRRLFGLLVVVLLALLLLRFFPSARPSPFFFSSPSPRPAWELRELSCHKTLLYTLEPPFGFYSELQLFARLAAYGRWMGYTILLNDQGWHYGNMSNYFDYQPPNCASQPGFSSIERVDFCSHDAPAANHVRMGRSDCVYGLEPKILGLVDPEVLEIQAVWNFINLRDEATTLPAGQNLHYRMKELFERQAHEFGQIWKPNAQIRQRVSALDRQLQPRLRFPRRKARPPKVVGLHYRLGDKAAETLHPETSSLNIGVPPSYDRPNRFLGVVSELVKDLGWPREVSEPVNVVVISDAAPHALARLEEHRDSFATPLPLHIVGLLPEARPEAQMSSQGYDQVAFNELPLEQRVKATQEFVSQMEWLRTHADGVVCSATSNPCSALMLMFGADKLIDDPLGPRSVVRSVDLRWSATSYPVFGQKKDLPREEIMRLGRKFAKDPRNHLGGL